MRATGYNAEAVIFLRCDGVGRGAGITHRNVLVEMLSGKFNHNACSILDGLFTNILSRQPTSNNQR